MKLNLSPAAKAAKAAYQRQWTAKNRDKTRKYMENYWERKASQGINDTVINPVSVSSKDTVTTNCQECGTVFTPQRKTARFCSDRCRVKFNRKHHGC